MQYDCQMNGPEGTLSTPTIEIYVCNNCSLPRSAMGGGMGDWRRNVCRHSAASKVCVFSERYTQINSIKPAMFLPSQVLFVHKVTGTKCDECLFDISGSYVTTLT